MKCSATCLSIVTTVLLLFSNTMVLSSENNAEPVEDMRYGMALYELYQEHYQQSLTEFAIAEKRGGIVHRGVDARLVKAGATFSYGLLNQAASDFTQLLDENEQKIAVFAKFKLAQTYFARQEFDAAFQLLSTFTPPSKETNWFADYYYLLGRTQLVFSDISHSKKSLTMLNEFPDLHDYLAHNILLQEIASGQADYVSIVAEDKFTDEQLALLDRSYVALGYNALNEQNHRLSTEAFGQVSQQSIWLNEALFGLAASYLQSEDYAKALPLLDKIITSPSTDIFSKQQAYVAKAHTLITLAKTQQALNALTQAKADIDTFVSILGALSQQVQDINWVTAKLSDEDTFLNEKHLLVGLLESADYASLVEQYNELTQLALNFERQQARLDTYQALLQEKRVRQNSLIKTNDLPPYLKQLEQFESRLSEISNTIKRAENTRVGLHTDDELEYIDMIEQAEKTLIALAKHRNTDSQAERLKRIKGILMWQHDYHFEERLYEAKTELASAKQVLQKARGQFENVYELTEKQSDFQFIAGNLTSTHQTLTQNKAQAASLNNRVLTSIQQLIQANVNTSLDYLKQTQIKLAMLKTIALENSREQSADVKQKIKSASL